MALHREINPMHVLQRLVEEHGSAAAAARHLGITKAYMSDILRGRRDVSDPMLEKLGLKRIERVVSAESGE